MRANISKENGYRHKVWFDAESPDEVYLLGKLSGKLKSAEKGFTLDCKISLGMDILELIEKAVEDKVFYEE